MKNHKPLRYACLSLCLIGLFITLLNWSPAASSQIRSYERDIERNLQDYDLIKLNPERVKTKVRQTGELSLQTPEKTFNLVLTPHDMRADNYRAEEVRAGGVVRTLERGPVHTYKGSVEGIEGAEARFTINGEIIEGLILTPDQKYFIEPARRYSDQADAADFVIYKESDVIKDSIGECGVTMAERVEAEAVRLQSQGVGTSSAVSQETPSEIISPFLQVDLATEADFEYHNALGSSVDANNEILSIMNQVDVIYRQQIGLTFSIVFQNVWATAADPYTQTLASGALDEFRTYWNINRTGIARDLAHMWTGKDLDGSTVGVAYSGVVCNRPTSSYGLSQRFTRVPEKFVLTAHEIGHNFSAMHTDGQPSECRSTIMEPTVGTGQTFCPFSRAEITNHVATYTSCLTLQGSGCTYAISPSSQSFGTEGGTGSVTVTTTSGCAWGAASTANWVTITSGESGTGNGTVNFTVAANSTATLRTATIIIGTQRFNINQAAGTCPTTSINVGQTISGTLATTDCRTSQRPNSYADLYTFSGTSGQQVAIAMSSSVLDSYLYLLNPSGAVIAENDDIEEAVILDARIPLSGFFTLPATGTYTIVATTYDPNATGNYTLSLTGTIPNDFSISANPPSQSVVPGGQTTYNVVTATTSGSPQTINLSVSGLPTGATATFNPASVTSGGSSTLTITTSASTAPGTYPLTVSGSNGSITRSTQVSLVLFCTYTLSSTSQSFTASGGSGSVSVTTQGSCGWSVSANSSWITSSGSGMVGSGTVNFTVARNAGMSRTGTLTIAGQTFTVTQAASTNPIDQAQFFVNQHYLDFLNRAPDQGGLNYWTGQITQCGSDLLCIHRRRIDVSAAFFIELEFQDTGSYVYRIHKTAYGTQPGFAQFSSDRSTVIGGSDLEAAKVAFVNQYVTRPEFIARYPLTLTPAQYVDALNASAGGALSQSERDALVAELSAGTRTRATALRRVADDQDFRNAEYNPSFVLMQYFGYLRRDVDPGGYAFWLDVLNNREPGNYRGMVCAFITSTEYQLRFGTDVVRSNGDCSQ